MALTSPLVLAVLAVLARQSFAQTTNATCVPGFEWSFNSLNQSPCLVAAYLLGGCSSDPASAFVDSLPEGFVYSGPRNAIQDNQCWCSTVTYSVFGMCGQCQGRNTDNWSEWDANCTNVYPGWQRAVPTGTAIPQWAYQDVTLTDDFNVTLAKQVAMEQPAKKKSHTGAIVGGVVGGVCGALLIAAAIGFWYFHRRRAPKANVLSTPPSDYTNVPSTPAVTPLMAQAQTNPMGTPLVTPSVPSSAPSPHMPLYDPENPETYPSMATAVPPQGMMFSQGAVPMQYGMPGAPYQQQATAYHGAPEL